MAEQLRFEQPLRDCAAIYDDKWSVTPVSVAMARGDLGVDFIFVYDRDCVNSQIGGSNVPDHQLARLPDAVVSHFVPGLSPREPPAVYVYPLPFPGRIISYSDEVRQYTYVLD